MAISGNPSTSYKNSRKQLNIGIFICTLILLYLVVLFCIYLFSGRTSVYEVTAGSVASKFDGQYTGLALREESIIYSPGTGYINFFVGDATPVSVAEQTYILDGSGKISAKLEEAAKNQTILSEDNLTSIRDTIHDFNTSFDPQHYNDVYAFKYRIQSQMLDLINGSVFESINKELAEMGEATYQIVSSDISGVVMHNVDGFEGLAADQVESSFFKKSNYQKDVIRTNDLVAEGDPVYKVITSEDWKILIQIDTPELFEGMDYVNIEFLKDNITATADIETFTKAGITYGVLSLDKYMIRYVSDRFLQIKILDNTQEGLKIPKTAVTERQYYTIPREYLTRGGNSNLDGFNKEVIAEDGSTSVTFVTPNIIRQTDTTCYVDTRDLDAGDILVMPESNSRYQVGEKENLQGVYTVNNGFAAFRLIDIIGENNSFYIIAAKKSGGVRLYDQVVRNGSSVEEGDLLNR